MNFSIGKNFFALTHSFRVFFSVSLAADADTCRGCCCRCRCRERKGGKSLYFLRRRGERFVFKETLLTAYQFVYSRDYRDWRRFLLSVAGLLCAAIYRN
jgi:hypothetical protein